MRWVNKPVEALVQGSAFTGQSLLIKRTNCEIVAYLILRKILVKECLLQSVKCLRFTFSFKSKLFDAVTDTLAEKQKGRKDGQYFKKRERERSDLAFVQNMRRASRKSLRFSCSRPRVRREGGLKLD